MESFLNHSDQDHSASNHHHHGPDRKRKRSPSHDLPSAPSLLSAHPQASQSTSNQNNYNHMQHSLHHQSHPAKLTKPTSPAPSNQHLTINYLARQFPDDLPLVTNNDGLQSIISLVGDYHGVLDRNESLACNLGARSLGPILIKRFERMFDAPPRVIVNHGKEGTQVTWLDVADFARNKPDQFALERNSAGQQICQFWTKQCQVQISEDDYVLISSGIPQRMIPPQPIVQDEENELGTLEILEKNLNGIVQLADQVAAKARQLNHRMRSRKQAILDRRASDAEISYTAANAANATSNNVHNANSITNSPVGFVAVNSRQHVDSHSDLSRSGASQATHHDLMSRFFTTNEKSGKQVPSQNTPDDSRRPPRTTSNSHTPQHSTRPSLAHLQSMHSQHNSSNHLEFTLTDSFAPNQAVAQAAAMSALGIPASLAGLPSLQQQSQSAHLQTPQPPTPSIAAAAPPFASSTAVQTPPVKDEGPYKSQMVHRMDQLKKGDIIFPPCDRCRRLHMDCLKNLTACVGCTKKHAKCSWREVTETELLNSVPPINPGTPVHPDDNAGSAAMVDPQLKDRSKISIDGAHAMTTFNDIPSAHPYSLPTINGMNGRSMSYQRPISSRSSSGNGHGGGGFDPQILNADTSTPNGHHIHEMQSPLDPATAASLAAAAQAVSSRDGSESNDRRARDNQREKMGMGVGAVVA